VLLTWSLEEALQTGDSMTARGYGVAKRSTYSIYKPDRQDKLILLVLTLSGMIALFFWLQGYGTLEIYPRMKSMDFGWQDAVMYGSFCLFVLLPAGLEGKEKWLWRSSKRNKYPSAILKKTGTRSMSSRSQ
jgi:energy-coupling factor transport system permease protein